MTAVASASPDHRLARLTSETRADDERPTPPPSVARGATNTDALVVRLVTIGNALRPPGLMDALGESSMPELQVTVSSRPSFDREAFLRDGSGGSADIEVWVDASDPQQVRLYFVSRPDARYALRTLKLSGEMDELDREAVAQAIRWSLQSLIAGSADTMSQREAVSALAVPEEPVVAAPTHGTLHRTSSPGAWNLEALVFYRSMLHSDAVGLAHGPGLGIGFERSTTGLWLGLRASAHLQLPHGRSDPRIGLELTSLASRIGLHLLAPLSEHARVGTRVELGLDTVWVSPRANSDTFVPRQSSTHHAPLTALGLVGQLKLTPFLRIEAVLGMEVDFAHVRYELLTADGHEPVIERHPVRPFLALGVLWF